MGSGGKVALHLLARKRPVDNQIEPIYLGKLLIYEQTETKPNFQYVRKLKIDTGFFQNFENRIINFFQFRTQSTEFLFSVSSAMNSGLVTET